MYARVNNGRNSAVQSINSGRVVVPDLNREVGLKLVEDRPCSDKGCRRMTDICVRAKELIRPDHDSIGEVHDQVPPTRLDLSPSINDPIWHRTAAADLPSAILDA